MKKRIENKYFDVKYTIGRENGSLVIRRDGQVQDLVEIMDVCEMCRNYEKFIANCVNQLREGWPDCEFFIGDGGYLRTTGLTYLI